MIKGDIVLINFPFTDFSGSKLRPALVLIADKEDVTVAFITTNLKEVGSSDFRLNVNQNNGLKKESLLKLNKIATINLDLVMGKIGNLTEIELTEVDMKLIEAFNIIVKKEKEVQKEEER